MPLLHDHRRRVPTQDIDCSVVIGMGAEAAVLTDECRLAFAALPVHGSAVRAGLRCLRGIDLAQVSPAFFEFVNKNGLEAEPSLLLNQWLCNTIETTMNGRKRNYGLHKRWLWNTGRRNCVYCGLKLTITPNQRNSMTLEHLKPLSRGGYNKRSNYAPACKGCNNGKGSATVEEFARNIIHRPEKRSRPPPHQ